MNQHDDDMREVMRRSLEEAGLGRTDDGSGIDVAGTASRIRGVRRRRAAATAGAGLLSVGLIAAVAWQTGVLGPQPAPPMDPPTSTTETGTASPEPTESDPTESGPTDPEPTGTETTDANGDGGAPLPWTPSMLPTCGEPFAMPDGELVLEVRDGPDGAIAPDGGWLAEVVNPGQEQVGAGSEGPVAVVVDGDGVVVAAPTEFLGPVGEGPPVLAVASQRGVTVPVLLPASCTGGALAPGEYQTFALVPLGTPAADGSLDMGAGGPWPLTVAEDGGGWPQSPVVIEGAVPFPENCGEAWDVAAPVTTVDLALVDQIRTPRDVGDEIDGRSRFTPTEPIDGATAFAYVLVLRDGVRVSGPVPGTDNVAVLHTSADASQEMSFSSDLTGCAGEPLDAGDHDVAVLLLQQTRDGTVVVAATDPTPVTLR